MGDLAYQFRNRRPAATRAWKGMQANKLISSEIECQPQLARIEELERPELISSEIEGQPQQGSAGHE